MTAAARTSASFPPDFIRRLEAALGRPIVEPNDAKAYLTDWRGFLTAHNAIVVRPGSTGEVSRIVRACAEARVFDTTVIWTRSVNTAGVPASNIWGCVVIVWYTTYGIEVPTAASSGDMPPGTVAAYPVRPVR